MGTRDTLTMFLKKKAFTLVELMVAILLSAIIVFFSYTMTISAYKMFNRMHNTSYSTDNLKFFEEAFKKSVTEACDITTDPVAALNVREFRFRRYDGNIEADGAYVEDIYTLEKDDGDRVEFRSNNNGYEIYPENITEESLSNVRPARLFVETINGSHRTKILLLKNIKAFYYKFNKTNGGGYNDGGLDGNNLKDISIGIVYYDDSSKITKRENRTFCFTARSV